MEDFNNFYKKISVDVFFEEIKQESNKKRPSYLRLITVDGKLVEDEDEYPILN